MLSSRLTHSNEFSTAVHRAGRPTRRRRVATPALLLAGLATVASACGAGADAGAEAADASPLEALFGWGDYDEAEGRRQELETQQQMVVCMKNEGFEYIAVDWAAQSPQVTDDDANLDWGSDEFGEKYGYGVIRGYETWEADQIEATNGGTSIEDDYQDPNSDYVETLSPGEQTAYYEALYGKQDEQFDEDGEWMQPPLEEQGCQGQAQLAVHGEDIWNTPGFSDTFEEASKRLESDPRMLNANADWTVCMAASIEEVDAEGGLVDGMSIGSPNDMYQSLDTIKAVATGQQLLPLDPETGEPIGDFDDTGGWSSFSDEDGNGFAMVGKQHLISAERIDEIQALEIKIWKQDKKCQDDVDFETISRDLEQQLADDLISQYPQLADESSTPDTIATEDGT